LSLIEHIIHCGRGDSKSLARLGGSIQNLRGGDGKAKKRCIIPTARKDKNRRDLHWYQFLGFREEEPEMRRTAAMTLRELAEDTKRTTSKEGAKNG
jgi:hypothetical protein